MFGTGSWLGGCATRACSSAPGPRQRPLMREDSVLSATRESGRASTWVMQCIGAVMSASTAAERPIHIVESGPAAGVIASLELARRLSLDNVITLDMGGTTAKTSIIEDGQLHRAAEYEVGAGINV